MNSTFTEGEAMSEGSSHDVLEPPSYAVLESAPPEQHTYEVISQQCARVVANESSGTSPNDYSQLQR